MEGKTMSQKKVITNEEKKTDGVKDTVCQTEHKQVKLEEFGIECDEGLADIIYALNKWGFTTNNSCQDNNGKIWVCFDSYYDVFTLYQMILQAKTRVCINSFKDNLFDYLLDYGDLSICMDEDVVFDPNNEDTVQGIGRLNDVVSLRFPKKDFPKFRKFLLKILK
jgi:hypothetical protein